MRDHARIGPRLGLTALAYVHERTKLGEFTGESPTTYRKTLWLFARHAGADLPVSRLNRRHVERWILDMEVAQSTLRQRLVTVRGFCQWCVVKGYLRRDPTIGIKGPSDVRTVPRSLFPFQIAACLRHCPDVRAGLMICLGCQLGLRCCEIATVQLGDVDHQERQLVVRQGKGGHQRVLPIPDEAWDYLVRYIEEHPAKAGPLIRSYRHPRRGLSAHYVSMYIGGIMHQAGVAESAHALRHSMATDVLRGGAHVRDVQAALGHRHLKATERYLPLTVGDLRTAMEGRTYRDAPDGRLDRSARPEAT